jgi:hypothetical protein
VKQFHGKTTPPPPPTPRHTFYIKTITLPRQARDKRREGSTHAKDCFYADLATAQNIPFDFVSTHMYPTDPQVRKTPVWRQFILNMIIEARQVRDKDGESTQKGEAFSYSWGRERIGTRMGCRSTSRRRGRRCLISRST